MTVTMVKKNARTVPAVNQTFVSGHLEAGNYAPENHRLLTQRVLWGKIPPFMTK